MDPAPAEPIFGFDLTRPPPEAPRAVTPAIARRIWTEPSVRAWWLATLLLALVAASFVGDRVYARHQQSQLIAHGVHVTGTVLRQDLKNAPHQLVEPNREMTVGFKDSSGHQIEAIGIISQTMRVGDPVPVIYDPANPNVWTDRTAPPGWVETLFGVVFVFPVVIAVGLVAWWQTARMRKVWQDAPAVVAVVSDRRQTPVAPMSWVVKCSLRDGTDRRLFNVHVPRFFGTMQKGCELWVLVPRRGKPVAAGWFL
jgi:hypothetical protein